MAALVKKAGAGGKKQEEVQKPRFGRVRANLKVIGIVGNVIHLIDNRQISPHNDVMHVQFVLCFVDGHSRFAQRWQIQLV